MSKLDLEAIKERAALATEGPWCNDGDGLFTLVDGMAYEPLVTWRREDFGHAINGEFVHSDDAVFTAHARTDIPALIAEVETSASKLQMELERSERLRNRLNDAEARIDALRAEGEAKDVEIARMRRVEDAAKRLTNVAPSERMARFDDLQRVLKFNPRPAAGDGSE